MQNRTKLAVMAALITIAVARVEAQSTNNLVQPLTISLTGFAQTASNSTTAVRVVSRDLVNALNQLTVTNGDNSVTTNDFLPGARLLVVTPAGTSNTMFIVRETVNRTNVDVDVSSFFAPGLGSLGSVSRMTTTRTGKIGGVEYSISTFSFSTPTLVLNLQGFTTSALANGAFTSSVNGPGLVAGNPAVLRGTVALGAEKAERH